MEGLQAAQVLSSKAIITGGFIEIMNGSLLSRHNAGKQHELQVIMNLPERLKKARDLELKTKNEEKALPFVKKPASPGVEVFH
jgi:hypothetical protein